MKRCIFCKTDSTRSRSVEHIVPESLGNRSHVLPPGVVCDKCNQYFASKVEKPFLESAYFRALRFAQSVPSKKGRIPALDGIITPDVRTKVMREPDGAVSLALVDERDVPRVLAQRRGMLLLPATTRPPDDVVVTRLLAKMALEALAQRLLSAPYPGGHEYLVSERQFDPLRDYARRPRRGEVWEFSARRIYDENAVKVSDDGQLEQTIHEYDFLVTPHREYYFVIAIFGVEFALNCGGPEIDGYRHWLAQSGGLSPLYQQDTMPMPPAEVARWPGAEPE